MFQRLQAEAKSLIRECMVLSYYMRGAIQYEDILLRTFVEREIMSDFVEDTLKEQSKSPHPVY